MKPAATSAAPLAAVVVVVEDVVVAVLQIATVLDVFTLFAMETVDVKDLAIYHLINVSNSLDACLKSSFTSYFRGY